MTEPTEPDEDSFDRTNAALEQGYLKVRDALVAKGLPLEEVEEKASKAYLEVIDRLVPDYADSWQTDGLEHVAELREYEGEFRERLHDHWGSGLDLFMVVIEFVEEMTSRCIARVPNDEFDLLFDVVVQLNGQALRVAREVHVLLTAGFPMGAMALTRTIHELSVRVAVLTDHGRQPGHEDLAQRYVDHGHVVNAKDADAFQRSAELLGEEPFEADFIDEVSRLREEAMCKYGSNFKNPYGWAAGLPGIPFGRRFDELEELARASHLRAYYMWSSHLVHGDAKALRLNQVERGGAVSVLTNATNVGLADPANLTMLALNRIAMMLMALGGPEAVEILMMRSVGVLVDRAQDAFLAGQHAVEDAEERLQAELAEEGKAMTPSGIVDLIEVLEPDD